MSARRELERFLEEHQIDYDLSSVHLKDETSYSAIRAVCEYLVSTTPPMLAPGNLANLRTLMKVGENAWFFTGLYDHGLYSHRPKDFSETIRLLFDAQLLTQDTFNAVCKITTASPDDSDIIWVAQCLIEMKRLNLLSKPSIDLLITKILKAPPRILVAFTGRVMTQYEELLSPTSCAEQLHSWLNSAKSITQNDFDIMMNCRKPVAQVSACRDSLTSRGLWNTPNLQALLDIDFCRTHINFLPGDVCDQTSFNRYILDQCHLIMNDLSLIIRTNLQDSLMANAGRIVEHCFEMHNNYQKTPQDFPGDLLHGLVLVKRALPTLENHPTQENIQELMAFADEAKGRPSNLWQAIGLQITLLCTAIGVALFPVSVGLTIGATVAALTGIGLFAYASRRNGLSRECLDLAEAVQHESEPPRVVY